MVKFNDYAAHPEWLKFVNGQWRIKKSYRRLAAQYRAKKAARNGKSPTALRPMLSTPTVPKNRSDSWRAADIKRANMDIANVRRWLREAKNEAQKKRAQKVLNKMLKAKIRKQRA